MPLVSTVFTFARKFIRVQKINKHIENTSMLPNVEKLRKTEYFMLGAPFTPMSWPGSQASVQSSGASLVHSPSCASYCTYPCLSSSIHFPCCLSRSSGSIMIVLATLGGAFPSSRNEISL